MTFLELKINLDLLDEEDRLDFINDNLPYFKTKNNKFFIVCEEGDCHLLDKNGNECNINQVKIINEFIGYNKLVAIDIPNSVTSIGDEAFSYCSGLMSATIGKGVTNIGSWAFFGCSRLTNVVIGSGEPFIKSGRSLVATNLKKLSLKAKQ